MFEVDFTDSEEDAPDTQNDFLNFSFKHTSNLEALNKKLMRVDSTNTSPREEREEGEEGEIDSSPYKG